jgi:hypothetical protein
VNESAQVMGCAWHYPAHRPARERGRCVDDSRPPVVSAPWTRHEGWRWDLVGLVEDRDNEWTETEL